MKGTTDMLLEPEWAKHMTSWSRTGSRVICDPAPTNTDEDWICLAIDYDRAIVGLEANGFKSEGKPEFYTGNNRGNFRSLRRGEINLILTDQIDFFNLFVSATELARRFNLVKKADRIALFQVVLYGVEAHNIYTQERTTHETTRVLHHLFVERRCSGHE